jgi:hypothetical protein
VKFQKEVKKRTKSKSIIPKISGVNNTSKGMVRQSTYIQIPEDYVKNDRLGLCRVCGKPKSQWDKSRRKYCSDDCWWKYQECFKTWTTLRSKILERDKQCVKCGSKLQLEIDHIQAIVNQGDMWNEDNLRVLCHKCHCKKTKSDLYERKYINRNTRILDFMN